MKATAGSTATIKTRAAAHRVINPQGESYRYILDNCGRVTEERDWGGVVWRYRYDADGLCTAGSALEKPSLQPDAAGRQKSSRRKAKRSMPRQIRQADGYLQPGRYITAHRL